jgi:EmrB/QacA subfamily drug resistance transporter
MEMPMEAAPEKGAAQQPGQPGARLRGAQLAFVLAAIMCTLLLAALDQTIVGTALPTIASDLNGYANYSWVLTSYLLTSTTMTPIIGKLSDLFGRKWFVVVGILIFLAGSALSGASATMTQLILFRGLQGIGAGMIMSLVFTLIGDIFLPAERAKWQGLFSGVFALASVIGPAVGGYITQYINWRWVFYVNLPIGILALFLIIFFLPTSISLRNTTLRGWAAIRRIDFLGALTAAGATVCLLLGLTWGGSTYPWDDPHTIIILSAAGALFVAFGIVEIFAKEPILPLKLFRNQVFASGALIALLVGAALFASAIYLPTFVQGVLQQPATNSGLVTTPLVLTMAIGGTLVGLLISRIGRYQVLSIIGGVIMVGGMFLLSQMGTGTTTFEVTRNMIILGLGMGMIQPVMTLAVQNAIPRNQLGVGTSAVTYLRSLGATLGTAVLGTVINNTMSSQIASNLPAGATQLPAKLISAATNEGVLVNVGQRQAVLQGAINAATAQVPPGPSHDVIAAGITQQVTGLMGQIFSVARDALASGIQNAFYISVGVAVALVVVTFFLKDVPLAKRVVAPAAAVITAEQNAALNTPELPAPALFAVQANTDLTQRGNAPIAYGHVVSSSAPLAIGYGYYGNGYNGNGHSGNGYSGNGHSTADTDVQGDTAIMPTAVGRITGIERATTARETYGTPFTGSIPSTDPTLIGASWYTRYEAAKQEMENAVVGFLLTHPEYLPAGQRSVSRFTLELLDQHQFRAIEAAMREAALHEHTATTTN